MKTIILAGGYGTRLSEKTIDIPKPMVEINQSPILLHIMLCYAIYHQNNFVIATGYKADVINEWVLEFNKSPSKEYYLGQFNQLQIYKEIPINSLKIETCYTGLDTQTAGRIKKTIDSINDEVILVTYGDGLANINIDKLINFHKSHGKIATVTAVRPPARFGHLNIKENVVTSFSEKNQTSEGWINGGFFVLNREIIKLINGDLESFEFETLPKLASMHELMAFHHEGFWKPMDTLRDQIDLEKLAKNNVEPPPWLIQEI
jgi:glucose-1-phosphate cytidylyltransferase